MSIEYQTVLADLNSRTLNVGAPIKKTNLHLELEPMKIASVIAVFCLQIAKFNRMPATMWEWRQEGLVICGVPLT